ncbi:MAG TPA: hypothetical protein VF545_09205 [Thermoleophilaceae bacterium]|jgi:hypothetical protein
MRAPIAASAALLGLALLPSAAAAHAERWTHYPDPNAATVPKHRGIGPARVVCKPDSAKRIRRSWAGRGRHATKRRRETLALLKRCRYRHVQQAVDAAKSGDRILLLPGVYREEPSRRIPVKDPRCQGDEFWEDSGDNHQEDGRVPTYDHQAVCPNARNLIAIVGDSLADEDRVCDHKCNLQIDGRGRRPEDVVLQNDRLKQDVIRADRADGFQLRNVLVEQGGYNNVDVVETNGFRLTHLKTRWAKNYGILTFTSDNGLYALIEAYGNGDSGVYPGSGPERHCKSYGIEVRDVDSHDNVIGQSGTSGNGTWIHDSRFHHNSAGISNDSFAPGHPGMPQDCSKWTDNLIYSNNKNPFEDDNEAYCNSTPFEKRRKDLVCPQFLAVVGAGFMFYGVNRNQVTGNRIYDNWRTGLRLFWVPSTLRGDNDADEQTDNSNGNQIRANWFGVAPDGSYAPNGQDVYWDEQGIGNCWEGNLTAPDHELTSDPANLPTCASGGSISPVSNPAKTAGDAPCATWNPRTNSDPPGCAWFTTPPPPER